jgi:peptidoglycan/xylan/chitin deacetylase (PgdA/CDA1 family)
MTSSLVAGVCAGLGAAASFGLAAGAWAYVSRYPGSRLFGEALTAPPRPGEIALTFDDGPNPAWTPRLLDTLAAHNVQASFFLLGNFARATPDLVRRIAAAGHLIGNHSWSHPDLSLESKARIRAELQQTSDTLAQILGAPVRYFRPPFGARRSAVFRIARELGLQTALWNAMTSDWSEPSAERIAARLGKKVDGLTGRGHAVNIVLHDGGYRALGTNRGPSVAAAGALLAQYTATHRFVRLDAWGD